MKNINLCFLAEAFDKKIDHDNLIQYLEKVRASKVGAPHSEIIGELIEELSPGNYEQAAAIVFTTVNVNNTLFSWFKNAALPEDDLNFLEVFLELMGIHEQMSSFSENSTLDDVELIFHENLGEILKQDLIDNGMLAESISHYFDIESFTRETIATDCQYVQVDAPNLLNISNQDYYIKN